MSRLLTSHDVQDQQNGRMWASLEYENLLMALNLALEAQTSIQGPYLALTFFLTSIQDHRRGLELDQAILKQLESYSPEKLSDRLKAEIGMVLLEIANRQVWLKQFEEAESNCLKSLSFWHDTKFYDAETIRKLRASTYDTLGATSVERRQWEKAEGYFQQALQLKADDRYEQARTYFNLGMATAEQKHFQEAERYYQLALQIKKEFNDRKTQARIYSKLASLAEERQQWPQAIRHYQQALKLDIEFNDRNAQAITYRNCNCPGPLGTCQTVSNPVK